MTAIMANKDINPRVKVSDNIEKGKPFQVRTVVSHPMYNGLSKDPNSGKTIPRDIINLFVATYNGNEVFRSVWQTSVSTNPFISFYVVATSSGKMELKWVDDAGVEYTTSVDIKVNG